MRTFESSRLGITISTIIIIELLQLATLLIIIKQIKLYTAGTANGHFTRF